MHLRDIGSCFALGLLFFSFWGSPALGVIQPAQAAKLNQEGVEFDHIEGNTLFYSLPASSKPPVASQQVEDQPQTPQKPLTSYKTSLFDISYVGQLQASSGGLPYFILSGKSCENCGEDRAIYLVRPTGEKPSVFVFPGKLLDPKRRNLLLESRAFFGKCLPHYPNAYVVFQKEKIDRHASFMPSVFIAQAEEDHLKELFLERHLPTVNTALQFVKSKVCKEITGRNRVILPKSKLLRNPQSEEESEDEDGVSESAHD